MKNSLFKCMRKNCSSSSNNYQNFIKTKFNSVVNICAQNENIVIERLGQFHKVQKPGIFIALPLIDRLKYCIDIRELAVRVDPQHSITEDNVSIELGGVIYLKFIDPYKAAYGVTDPIYAITQFAQSAMRAVVGKHNLDEIFHNREKLNEYIINNIKSGCEAWGATVMRYEVTDVIIAHDVKDAMSKQASAERKRREDVLHAEALKKSQILESEGLKQKLINESEGRKIQIENQAEAEANAIKIRADALKYEAIAVAEGKALTIEILGKRLVTDDGQKAAQIQLATQYINEFGKVVGKSSNLIIPGDLNDITGFVSKAMSIGNFINVNKNDKI